MRATRLRSASVVAGALVVRDLRSTFLGIPLPPCLTPRVHARGIDADGAIEVAVRIGCAPLGLLVEYGGRVERVSALGGS